MTSSSYRTDAVTHIVFDHTTYGDSSRVEEQTFEAASAASAASARPAASAASAASAA